MDIFKNSTRKVPKSDPDVVRIDMTEAEIGGRKSHMPNAEKSDKMTITHVAGESGKE